MALKKPTPAFENETAAVATAEAQTPQTPNEATVNLIMGDVLVAAVTQVRIATAGKLDLRE